MFSTVQRALGRPLRPSLYPWTPALGVQLSPRSNQGCHASSIGQPFGEASEWTLASVLSKASNLESGSEITLAANVRTIRNQKQRSFVKLGDGSTPTELQAVLKPAQADGLNTGTFVQVTGRWYPSPGAEQPYELHASQVKMVGVADPAAYPIQKKYQTPEYLRTLPHLRQRTLLQGLLTRLRNEVEFRIAEFFYRRHYVRVATPVITSSDCEGAGAVFSVAPKDPEPDDQSFFRSPKHLTVSAQLHLEAFVSEHPSVWTMGPTFRAERSDTSRHLSEFAMLEVEIRTGSLELIMDTIESLVTYVGQAVEKSQIGADLRDAGRHASAAEQRRAELATNRINRLHSSKDSWLRIKYHDAVTFLCRAFEAGAAPFAKVPSAESGLSIEHERFLAAEVGSGLPVFVTHYPSKQKPFYMLPDEFKESQEPTALCFDVLLPDVGELAGGSLREHRLEPLLDRMRQCGLVSAASNSGGVLDWYLDLRRYGSVPHGGFGLGLDRLLGYLAGWDNVRETVPWPRYYGRCDG